MTLKTAPEILQAGISHIQDRAKTYDKPEGERSIGRTITAFNAITGLSLTEEQGWLMMGLLKMVRSQQGDFKLDNYEDEASYAALRGECASIERVKFEPASEIDDDSPRQQITQQSGEMAEHVYPAVDEAIAADPRWIAWDPCVKEFPPRADSVSHIRRRDGRIVSAGTSSLLWGRCYDYGMEIIAYLPKKGADE